LDERASIDRRKHDVVERELRVGLDALREGDELPARERAAGGKEVGALEWREEDVAPACEHARRAIRFPDLCVSELKRRGELAGDRADIAEPIGVVGETREPQLAAHLDRRAGEKERDERRAHGEPIGRRRPTNLECGWSWERGEAAHEM